MREIEIEFVKDENEKTREKAFLEILSKGVYEYLRANDLLKQTRQVSDQAADLLERIKIQSEI